MVMADKIVWTEKNIRDMLRAISQADPNQQPKYGQVEGRRIVYKMLQAMYQRQTYDEQVQQTTKHVNNVGFSGADAALLSDIAQKSAKYNNLTPKQARYVAGRLQKYAKQLASIAAAKSQSTLPLTIVPAGAPNEAGAASKATVPVHSPGGGEDCDICWGNYVGQQEAIQENAAYEKKMFWKQQMESGYGRTA